MARVKQTSRSNTRKRLPVATISRKNSRKIKKGIVPSHVSINTPPPAEEVKEEMVPNNVPTIPSKISSHAWAYFSSSSINETSFSEGTTDKMEGLPEYAGKWLLFNDEGDLCSSTGMSHQDYAWQIAKTLVVDFKNTGIISAKCSTLGTREDSHYGTMTQGVICCYTANYKDKRDVKRAADAIRKAYPYPLSMYYKPEKDSLCGVYSQHGDRLVTMYKHSIENQFYERDSVIGYKWKLVDFSNEEVSINEATMPSRVTSHQWLYISSTPDNSDVFKVGTSDYIENLPDTAGKWLLFHSANDVCPLVGMSHHDNAWQCIRPLVTDFKNTGIITVKCSTSIKDRRYRSGKGVICCYTADYQNKMDVKRAADSIREAYFYPCPMYYKTEDDTDAGVYRQYGDRQVTTYKHTPDNKLFERDIENQGEWKLIDF